MKVEQFEGTQERIVLAQIVCCDKLLEGLGRLMEKRRNLLRTPVENMLLEWCVKYYRTNGQAPRENIKWILNDFTDSPLYNELGMVVDNLPIEGVAVVYEMIVDDVCQYLDKVALERMARSVLSRASQNDIDGCVEAIGKFTRASLGVTSSVNPFSDRAALVETFSDDSCKSLLEFRDWGDDARTFFGDTFSRASFVVFNAPEKGCKSATLLEMAIQALKEGKKVAYFEAGDMSRPQVFRRLYQRISNHPRRAGKIQRPDMNGEFWVEKSKDEGVQIHNDLEELTYCEDLSLEIAEKATQEWEANYGDMKQRFRFSDHPQDLTVPGIAAELDEWERQDGFKPDFVIVDYADLLQPVVQKEFRHQINDNFARLRAISLARRCCLVTATQAKGQAYNTDTQSRSLISEDKRKAAYPTAMIGLASVQEEREQQVYHLNFILRRDDVCVESVKLYFSQCLAVCNPMVRCYLPENHKGEMHGTYAEEAKAIAESLAAGIRTAENLLDDEITASDPFDIGGFTEQTPVASTLGGLEGLGQSTQEETVTPQKKRKMPPVPKNEEGG